VTRDRLKVALRLVAPRTGSGPAALRQRPGFRRRTCSRRAALDCGLSARHGHHSPAAGTGAVGAPRFHRTTPSQTRGLRFPAPTGCDPTPQSVSGSPARRLHPQQGPSA
jgi:hypothetical protein